jgi:hypothetical protein
MIRYDTMGCFTDTFSHRAFPFSFLLATCFECALPSSDAH